MVVLPRFNFPPGGLLFGLVFLTFVGPAPAFSQAYDLERPRHSWTMPGELNEISGLTIDPSGRYLLAVQDELGLIYFLDRQTGAVVNRVPFWDEGDYEGIETVGDEVYVVKNTGTLYRVTHLGAEAQEETKYNGFLNSDYDVEGLAYDAHNQRLLLACKAQPEDASMRQIFAFDLTTHTFLPEPVTYVRMAALQAFVAATPRGLHHKFYERFGADEEEMDFHPSALAIHPRTGRYLVASGNGRMLMSMRANGEVTALWRLDKDLLRQLEGICFAEDGTLYLASERKGDDPAVVHVYESQP